MFRCILILILMPGCLPCVGQATDLDVAFGVIKAAVADKKVPGAIGLVSQHGRILREEAHGHSDTRLQRRMTPRTLCWIASITKPVTVAAAMKLVDAGQLALDDPVEKYLPDFKKQTGPGGKHYPITIRQLMSHSSGIQSNPPLRPAFFFEADWYARDIDEVVHELAKTRLLFEPGARVAYSNAAPYLLARIIELRAGMRYDRFVQTAILDPLEMRDTYFAPPRSVASRMAEVVRREDDRDDTVFFRFDPAWQIKMAMPDGGLFSTPADVVKFTQMFIRNDGKVLSQESVRTMLTEQASGWGLGWALNQDGSFYHTGSSGTLTWGNPHTGVAGALFCQIQDYKTKGHESLKLRDQFREAVDTATKSPR
ncbi:serine hydrolase domain-containing protein [Lignipirellula cremea]|uniref:Esterase EstB n=1 Tax=Lignipirellula cremea TaxID=2528010 RepID=A0A518DLB0_9BACT|nr:serine hydrolase domain-containing protein [Lignipirellula cremea]QDU92618.1 Esterase EstB [Lignipirellula cremea]